MDLTGIIIVSIALLIQASIITYFVYAQFAEPIVHDTDFADTPLLNDGCRQTHIA